MHFGVLVIDTEIVIGTETKIVKEIETKIVTKIETETEIGDDCTGVMMIVVAVTEVVAAETGIEVIEKTKRRKNVKSAVPNERKEGARKRKNGKKKKSEKHNDGKQKRNNEKKRKKNDG